MRILFISKNKTLKLMTVFLVVLISILYIQNMEYPGMTVFLKTTRELPIYSVETNEKKIAISFDAAWGAEYTDDILKILNERNIKTTFFLVGFWVDHYPEKVKKIAQEGHEIGNHSTTHPHMSKLTSEQVKNEIQTTQEKLEELAGDKVVKLFRPPFGDYNDTLITTCRALGYYPIQWDVDSLDWKEYGVQHMINQIKGKVRNGSIILFHNNAKYTTEALPYILDDLKEKGYKIVPISQLIYKDDYYIDHTGRQKNK